MDAWERFSSYPRAYKSCQRGEVDPRRIGADRVSRPQAHGYEAEGLCKTLPIARGRVGCYPRASEADSRPRRGRGRGTRAEVSDAPTDELNLTHKRELRKKFDLEGENGLVLA